MNKETCKAEKQNGITERVIEIPDGKFYGGNCNGCIYYDPRDKDSTGRGYCSSFNTHYFPEERNGCFRRKG